MLWRAKICRGDSVDVNRGDESGIVELFRVA